MRPGGLGDRRRALEGPSAYGIDALADLSVGGALGLLDAPLLWPTRFRSEPRRRAPHHVCHQLNRLLVIQPLITDERAPDLEGHGKANRSTNFGMLLQVIPSLRQDLGHRRPVAQKAATDRHDLGVAEDA